MEENKPFMEANKPFKDSSEQLNELFSALAKAQAEMPTAGKSSNNHFFKSKYADLASVVEASRPYLAKNGLSVAQPITIGQDGKRVLVTILAHSSGQYLVSRVPLNTTKEDMQSLGSAVTYMRRYAYASLVGVVAEDEDDDGEAVARESRKDHRKEDAIVINKQQYDKLDDICREKPHIRTIIYDNCKVTSLKDIPADRYDKILKFSESQ